MAHLSQEKKLIDTFLQGRDPYATIATFVFHKDYWDCMEHRQDGSYNKEGKAIRGKAKVINLAILYGMRAKSLSKKLKISVEEAKGILEEFYRMFPDIKKFKDQTEREVKKYGVVEDYYGRQRHLPDVWLEELEFKAHKKIKTDADLFPYFSSQQKELSIYDEEKSKLFREMWLSYCENNTPFIAKEKIKQELQHEDVEIKDNGSFIRKVGTQCVNSRIQGSAATLTKKAMKLIYNDPVMKELGYRILIPIHDELLGECPSENAEKAEKRLTELMIKAGVPECSVPMQVDTYVVNNWYADEISGSAKERVKQLVNDEKNPIPEELAVADTIKYYSEFNQEQVLRMCYGKFDPRERILANSL